MCHRHPIRQSTFKMKSAYSFETQVLGVVVSCGDIVLPSLQLRITVFAVTYGLFLVALDTERHSID